MHRLSGNCSKLRRFIAGCLGITSTTVPVTFLMTCLAISAMLLTFSGCGPNPTMPPPHVRTPLVSTDMPTAVPSPTPTLLPPVTLVAPEDDSYVEYGSEVALSWSWSRLLERDEYYQLRVKVEEQDSLTFYHTKDDHYHLNSLLSGEYRWTVVIVRSIATDTYDQMNAESEWRHFHVLPPAPVVRSISPASILQGTSISVVLSGENFTTSVTLIIGIPLQATLVDSNTITATIPATLAVGAYPVIVQDSIGRGVSSVSFIVFEPLTPTPRVTPTPARPPYPPPVLGWGGIIGCNVTFRWEWSGTLAEDDWFAVRVGKAPNRPHAQTWTKELEYTYVLGEAGDYVWDVAICRGDPSDAFCAKGYNELVVSERETFWFGGCSH